MTTNGTARPPKKLASQKAVNDAVKGVCDVMRRSNVAGAMQYVPELTWLLFLRILDERETAEAGEHAVLGVSFAPSLEAPYRWQDWGAPPDADGQQGATRREKDRSAGALLSFVNKELLPHLKSFATSSSATPRQKVIAEVVGEVERVRIDTETNFKDVLDRVHEITEAGIDTQHAFPISQVYEGLLLKMGEKGGDGGQFYTPREVVRAMIRVLDPPVTATVYDPCCGTGGFLAEAYEFLRAKWAASGPTPDPSELERLKTAGFFGREKDNLAYPMALANLVLHGVDVPRIWHGNTLTGDATYADLFTYESAEEPGPFDVVLTNPPFGGKEGSAAQNRFAYKTGATQVLFLQHVIDSLKDGGRCALVIDEGVLFRTTETAFVQTKKKLLAECDLFCVVSLPGGVFSAAGAGVKTNLLFFEKGRPTEQIWYYDLSDVKVGKTKPLTLAHFDAFFELLPFRGKEAGNSEKSWTLKLTKRKAAAAKASAALRAQAVEPAAEAARLAERLKAMRQAAKADPGVAASLAEAEALQQARQQEAKRLVDRAQRIDDEVYDLKAVNPTAADAADDRTPEQLINEVEEQGRRLAGALARLRAVAAGSNGGDGVATAVDIR